MSSERRIRTVLYGDQRMESTELELLHTPALQRLYDLHQLGLTDRVFVDASHSRLQHVIGVLEQVDNVMEAIARNLERRKTRTLTHRMPDGSLRKVPARDLANYARTRRRAVRLMGLLHDLTHAPFGHTLEDEIQLQVSKHDDPERQADAFYRLLSQYVGWMALDYGLLPGARGMGSGHLKLSGGNEEQLARFLADPSLEAPPDTDEFVDFVAKLAASLLAEPAFVSGRGPTRSEFIQLFRDLRFAMRALLWLDALHKDKLDDLLPMEEGRVALVADDGVYAYERLIDRILAFAGEKPVEPDERVIVQRDAFFLDVIGNTICADLLDYAKRDSHFAGLRLDYDVDRIVENFTVVSYRRPRAATDKTKHNYKTLDPILRTAISIFSHKLRIDVPGELMNLLQVRFYVYQRVLFHPTKCIAGAMLGSALQLIGWDRLPKHYSFVGDAVFLHDVGEVARTLRALIAQKSARLDQPLEELYSELDQVFEALGSTSVARASRELMVARRTETVGVVLHDLEAALKLLQRLSARRYHKPIFRLLPSVQVPQLPVNAEVIATQFLDSKVRAAAEREIEKRAALPHGSVTIHCPKADGPKKIAEILILSEKEEPETVSPLRGISEVDKKIFEKHERAITAVEEMYASMWRLVVSISPPFQSQHVRINPVISRVLYAFLCGESYDTLYPTAEATDGAAEKQPCVPNDPSMERELIADTAGPAESAPQIRLIFADGHEETRDEAYLAAADTAIRVLSEYDERVGAAVTTRRSAAEAAGQTMEAILKDVLPIKPRDRAEPAKTLGEQAQPEDAQRELLPEVETPDGPREGGRQTSKRRPG